MASSNEIEVKSLTVESAYIDKRTYGGISIFDGTRLLSFVFQPEHVLNLRNAMAAHVNMHISLSDLDKERQKNFKDLKQKTIVSETQQVHRVTKVKITANNVRLILDLETTDGPFSLRMDNVSVVHFEEGLRNEFYEEITSGQTRQ